MNPYIPNTVRHKNCCCCTAFLGSTGDIRHADTNDQADHWPEEPDNCVASHRGGSSMRPTAPPDHGTACNYRETAEN